MLDQIGICGVWRMCQAWVFLISLLEHFLLFHKLHYLADGEHCLWGVSLPWQGVLGL